MAKPKQDSTFPTSQSELLKMARGALTQAQFAKALGVDRTCLSKYESEKLGAPASVISYCLRAIAPREVVTASDETMLRRALWSARQTLSTLEELSEARPTGSKATLD
ncbi:MAG: transcriptional regulator [Burkholderiales bacterium]